MADTYSSSNRFQIQTVGGNDGTWGGYNNTNIGTLIDEAISGRVSVTVAGSDVTLTATNGASDQARNAHIVLAGTPGATRNINFPDVENLKWVKNSTDAAQTLKAGAGTSVSLAVNAVCLLSTDGATNAVALVYLSATAATLLDDASVTAMRSTLSAAASGANGDITSLTAALTVTGGVSFTTTAISSTVDTTIGTTGRFFLSSVLTPAQLTANQNNYGIATNTIVRISSDAARDITGINSGPAGLMICLVNIGSFTITLKNESASSTAALRLAIGSDMAIAAGGGCTLWYDSTSSRWRCVGKY